jgi:hypothetical protein
MDKKTLDSYIALAKEHPETMFFVNDAAGGEGNIEIVKQYPKWDWKIAKPESGG